MSFSLCKEYCSENNFTISYVSDVGGASYHNQIDIHENETERLETCLLSALEHDITIRTPPPPPQQDAESFSYILEYANKLVYSDSGIPHLVTTQQRVLGQVKGFSPLKSQ